MHCLRRKVPENVAEDCLLAHNRYRALHASPPLLIDEKLNEYAQERAEKFAADGWMTQETSYGENTYVEIVQSPRWKLNVQDVVEYWYREGSYYRYGAPEQRNLKGVCNFTQLVWRDTKSMGLGMAVGDGKIYLVCNYEPAGNIEGEFADNVLPPKEEEKELQSIEEVGIKFLEPRMSVVASMERLYAVPSEKLRVWSVWLTKVGETGEEWQKWLRVNIDLVLRLLDRLQLAEEAARLTEEEEESYVDKSEETFDKTDPSETESRSRYAVKSSSAVDTDRGDVSLIPSTAGNYETSSGNVVESRSQESRTGRSKTNEGTEDEESGDYGTDETAWPIGRPWKPTRRPIDRESSDEELPVLKMPGDEEEMVKFIRSFTKQATIYRSFYKHWLETADRATKEVGGRTVMCTARVRGMVSRQKPVEITTAEDPEIDESIDPSKVEVAPADSTKRESGESEEYVTPPESMSDVVDDDPAAPKVENTGKPESTSPKPSTSASARSESASAKTQASKPDSMKTQSSKPGSLKTQTSKAPELLETECEGVDASIRDEARADEDIPYFFYLKAEPDIEIAIEHDDEEVIAADTDRESIVGDRRRVYFNLTDKPGKAGKPWI